MEHCCLLIPFVLLAFTGLQAQTSYNDSLVVQHLLDKAKAAEENDIRLADSFINQASIYRAERLG